MSGCPQLSKLRRGLVGEDDVPGGPGYDRHNQGAGMIARGGQVLVGGVAGRIPGAVRTAVRLTGAVVDGVRSSAYRVPTEQPESDDTQEWDSVTVVVAEIDGGGHTGIGYTYADAAAAG
jgi:hypothetical protein